MMENTVTGVPTVQGPRGLPGFAGGGAAAGASSGAAGGGALFADVCRPDVDLVRARAAVEGLHRRDDAKLREPHDVFGQRAHVSSARKLGALPAVAATFVRFSLLPGRSDRQPLDGRIGAPVVGYPRSERVGPALAAPSRSSSTPFRPEQQTYG